MVGMRALCSSPATETLIGRLLLVCVVASQCTGTVASLIAFGDSYSDNGQGANKAVQAALGTTQENSGYFPRPPYYQGRFSNGPNWLDIVAATVSNTLDSYAAGGAVTGAPGGPSNLPVYPPYDSLSEVANVAVPTGLWQVAEFLAQNNGTARPEHTYILEFGANDYLNVVAGVSTATVYGVISTIDQMMEILFNAGARKFIVLNVPPIAGLPLFMPPFTPEDMSSAAQAKAASLTAQHNAELPNRVESFGVGHHGSINTVYDTYSFFINLITNAAHEGFTVSPLTTPCYGAKSFYPGFSQGYDNPVCSDPDSHIFWDAVHLTAHANNLLAQDFVPKFPDLEHSRV
ncbi:hypothetical protein ABBQ38_000319 [Trebouxia sp. C0009 RCD-2024]